MMKTVLAAMLTTFVVITGALAHSPLKTTLPANEAVLADPPPYIELNFGKPARLTKVTLGHTIEGETNEKRLKLPSKAFGTTFKLNAAFEGAAESAGKYRVNWRALSEDGHALKGHFGFTVSSQ